MHFFVLRLPCGELMAPATPRKWNPTHFSRQDLRGQYLFVHHIYPSKRADTNMPISSRTGHTDRVCTRTRDACTALYMDCSRIYTRRAGWQRRTVRSCVHAPAYVKRRGKGGVQLLIGDFDSETTFSRLNFLTSVFDFNRAFWFVILTDGRAPCSVT